MCGWYGIGGWLMSSRIQDALVKNRGDRNLESPVLNLGPPANWSNNYS